MTTATASHPLDVRADRPRLADLGRNGKATLISPAVVKGLTRATDLVLAAVTGVTVAALYIDEPHSAFGPAYLGAAAFTSLAAVVVFEMLGVYRDLAFDRILKQMPVIVFGWSTAFALLESAVFFLKAGPEMSRGWLALWFAIGLAGLITVRLVLASLVRTWAAEGRLNRRAVIFGTGEVTNEVIRQLEADRGTDIRIAGIFDDRAECRIEAVISGYPYLGGLRQLVSFCRETRIDLIILALPVAGEQRFVNVAKQLAMLPADVKLPARATNIRFSSRAYSQVGSIAMIDIADKPISGWGTLSKSIFDKTVAFAALALLAPVMAAIAVAIRLDSRGPILFRQKRYGFNNELIEVLKFRSMYVDRCDADARKLVTRDDPRVTRVGRFIRKTSLDELPQLFNVLSGSLSLVGPRPHAVQARAENRLYDELVEGYFARHKVKPGITGWAQINGWRGETDTAEKIEKRVEHDLYYIENWSLLLDIYILAMTPASLVKSQNAY